MFTSFNGVCPECGFIHVSSAGNCSKCNSNMVKLSFTESILRVNGMLHIGIIDKEKYGTMCGRKLRDCKFVHRQDAQLQDRDCLCSQCLEMLPFFLEGFI